MRRCLLALPLLAAVALLVTLSPVEPPSVSAQPKQNKDDAGALAQVQLADKGLKVDVWAAAPLMANPVAFCFDEKGRMFVAETTGRPEFIVPGLIAAVVAELMMGRASVTSYQVAPP